MAQKQTQSQSSTPAPKVVEPTQKEMLHAINNDPNRGNQVPEVAPVVESITPEEAVLGGASFTVYLAGTGFTDASVIVFAGHDEPTTRNVDGTLSTGVNMDVWQGPDTVKVSVRNGTLMSNEVDFTFSVAPEVTRKRSR